jgi:hypothetical protein
MTMLAACGGGGGAAGTADTSQPAAGTFPIQTALSYVFTHGLQKTFNVTGTAGTGSNLLPITGSVTFTSGTAASTTFNSLAAQQVTQTLVGSLTVAGQSVPLSTTSFIQLNASYAELGTTGSGTGSNDYCVVSSGGTFPAYVAAGQTGTISTFSCYTDSSKSVPTGSVTETYVARAGNAANTLDFQLIDMVYDTSKQLVETQGTTYNVNSAGVTTVTQVNISGTQDGIAVTITGQ